MAQTERELRVQLAACYRIFDYMGWSEMIYNHITVKVPGDEHHFLINPYGLHYKEVTASNLVKVDIEGNIVEDTQYRVNPAGIVIHTAIHAARPDVQCIAHTYTNAGMAVACTEEGLRTDNFYSALLHNQIDTCTAAPPGVGHATGCGAQPECNRQTPRLPQSWRRH